MRFCAHLERKSLNIYRNKTYSENEVVMESETHILCSVYFYESAVFEIIK